MTLQPKDTPEQPQGQADPVAAALSGPWTFEITGEDWGQRANVYCPSIPGASLSRKLVAVSVPLPIAELIVDSVNDRLGFVACVGRAKS